MPDQVHNTTEPPLFGKGTPESGDFKRVFLQRRAEEARRDRKAAAARLTKLAEDARRQYLDELAAGGEPVYPAWVDDVTIVCASPVAPEGTVTPRGNDVLIDKLARLAYYYSVELESATRNADSDHLEGIARYVTAKLKSQIRSTLANDPAAAPSDETLRLAGVIADKIEDGTLFQAGIFSRRELADKLRAVVRYAQHGMSPLEPAVPSQL